MKRQHKFIEYYDVRDAEAAWNELNGKEVCGKPMKIEFSRQGSRLSSGGSRKHKLGQQEYNTMVPVFNSINPNSIDNNSNNGSSSQDLSIPLVNHGHGAALQQCGWIHNVKDHPNYIAWQGYGSPYVGFPQPLMEWGRTPPLLDQPPEAMVISSMNLHRGNEYVENLSSIGQPHILGIHPDLDQPPFMNGSIKKGKRFTQPKIHNPDQNACNMHARRRSILQNGHPVALQTNCRQTSGFRGGMNWIAEIDQEDNNRRVGPVHRGGGGHLVHFEFNESEVFLSSGAPRTTLMVRNIPNKYR